MNDDWRIRGQANYLSGIDLVHADWGQPTPERDHDHCEFCWAKFGTDGDQTIGYRTTGSPERWICQECFSDFHERFEWNLTKGPANIARLPD